MKIVVVYILAILSLTAAVKKFEVDFHHYHVNLNNQIKELANNVTADLMVAEQTLMVLASGFQLNIGSLVSSYGDEKFNTFKSSYGILRNRFEDRCKQRVDDLLQSNEKYHAEFMGYVTQAQESFIRSLIDVQNYVFAIKRIVGNLEVEGHHCSRLFDRDNWITAYNCVIKVLIKIENIASEAGLEITDNVDLLVESVLNTLEVLHLLINKSKIPAFYAGEESTIPSSCLGQQ